VERNYWSTRISSRGNERTMAGFGGIFAFFAEIMTKHKILTN